MKRRLTATLIGVVLLMGCAPMQEPGPSEVTDDPATSSLPEPIWRAREDEGTVLLTMNADDASDAVAYAAATPASSVKAACKPPVPCSPKKLVEYRKVLEDVAAQLRAQYGAPYYKGPVRVEVSQDLVVTARTIWRPTNGSGRLVHLSDLNFRPEDRKVVAHELFHALYQSDAFLAAYPDVVVEGLATSAEYVYRYPAKTRPEIARIMLEQLHALGMSTPFGVEALSRPFTTRSAFEKDLLYIASGHLFISQAVPDFQRFVRAILADVPVAKQSPERLMLALAERHALHWEEKVFDFVPPTKAGKSRRALDGPIFPCEIGSFAGASTPSTAQAFVLEIVDPEKLKKWQLANCPGKPER